MFQPLSFKCHCSATKCRINRNFVKELRRFCFLRPTHLPRRPLFKLDFNRFDYGWYQASILTWTGSSRFGFSRLGSSGKLVRYRSSRLLLIFLTWKRRHRTTLSINEQPRKNSRSARRCFSFVHWCHRRSYCRSGILGCIEKVNDFFQ